MASGASLNFCLAKKKCRIVCLYDSFLKLGLGHVTHRPSGNYAPGLLRTFQGQGKSDLWGFQSHNQVKKMALLYFLQVETLLKIHGGELQIS